MEENKTTTDDLFGEAVTPPTPKIVAAVAPRARRARTLKQKDDGATSLFATSITATLPKRYRMLGKLHDNPVSQLQSPHTTIDGKAERFVTNRVTSFRALLGNGEYLTIVPRKTASDLGNDPVLLAPDLMNADQITAHLASQNCTWVTPKPIDPQQLPLEAAMKACDDTVASWKDQFAFKAGSRPGAAETVRGLRKPQLGGLHAILAHSTCSKEPATVVMPTGTGKTETMLAAYVCAGIERLLVVVPTEALRDQIADKFETLGVLQEQECLPKFVQYPVVLRLEHIPKSIDIVDDLFSRANVIVTTMHVAGRAPPEIQERMALRSSTLFIDEAHHIKARTWRQFRALFMEGATQRPIFQFTATPFREDGAKVDGKFIYYYPLKQAQDDEYFGKVRFHSVSELEADEADHEIVSRVEQALKVDAASGFQHLAMARCHSIDRAKKVHELYAERLPHLNPLIVHSQMSPRLRREALAKLRRFESQIIVCVDMLGEGFDLPELKIAALHDQFKSIAVTLQFVGRFTRIKPTIGTATVIANTGDDRLDRTLAKLYAEESDWNFLIANLSGERIGREIDRALLFEGFKGELPDIPLQTIEPTMSAVVYKTDCTAWAPLDIQDEYPAQSFIGLKINEGDKIAVCVLRHERHAKWTKATTAIDVQWELLVVHWDETAGLLYISSTLGAVSDSLAKAVCGESARRIIGQDVFRCFHEFRQLVIRNLGLTHNHGGGVRYSMLMGIDVNEGLDSIQANERIKNNLFGTGFAEGEPKTLGCSVKGKFWSHAKISDFKDWMDWCHGVGSLITNENVSTSAAFASAMRPKLIEARPDAYPVAIHWPEGLLSTFEDRIEISFGDKACLFTECDIELANHSRTEPLRFAVKHEDLEAVFEVSFGNKVAKYTQASGPAASIKTPRKTTSLSEYFGYDAPLIDFGDGSFLIYSHHYCPPHEIDLKPLLDDKLIVWDWKKTNIRAESQGPEKRQDSIQYAVIQWLRKQGDFDIIFDDDGTGEFADVIAMKIHDKVVTVTLFHCKYSSADEAGSRLKDIYEVAGQTLKSVQWCHRPKRFLRHMLTREKTRLAKGQTSRFEVGNKARLRQLAVQWEEYRFEYQVRIVQPGLSKAKIEQSVMHVLAFVEKALIEHRRIPLNVIMSA